MNQSKINLKAIDHAFTRRAICVAFALDSIGVDSIHIEKTVQYWTPDFREVIPLRNRNGLTAWIQ